MGRWLTEIFDRIFAAICALLFAQLPLFMQQYQQQLTGAAAELTIQISNMRHAALLGGKTLTQYIQKFLESGDADFVRQGELVQAMYDRSIALAQASHALMQATALEKPLLFFKHLKQDIAASTLSHFQPGIPFTFEGMLYALMGLLFGYVLFFACKRLFFAARRRKKLVEVPVEIKHDTL